MRFFLGFLTLASALFSAQAKPLNVVVLYADDWRHDTLGCAGHPIVKTPHLDELAEVGTRFTHGCVTTSICGVSRATLFTGQWMSRHGNKGFTAFKTPWAETYPGLLRSNGYHVGHIGKWHNGPFPQKNFDFGRSYSGTHWMKNADGTRIHVTQKNHNDALEFLRTSPKDKPFCLTLAFFATHAEDGNPQQYLPQEKSMKLYRDAVIAVPRNANDAAWRKLPSFLVSEKNESRNRYTWRFDNPEKYQTMMKNYYRLATEVDGVCGAVVAELKARGFWENTLVIFTTDNGYFHGEHGLADKWYPHEESIRVPLIVRDPRIGTARQVRTNDALALNVDLAPTILDAAGIDVPRGMQGKSLSPLLTDAKAPWRSEFFYEHAIIQRKEFIPASQALVRHDEKYMFWPDFKVEQFFDLTKDPLEEIDQIDNPQYATKITAMRKRFAELKKDAL
jgi:arylsulfatase A-like enzyme